MKAFSMQRFLAGHTQLYEWTIQASNNNADFTDIESYARTNWAPVETFLISTADEPYCYWRVKVTRKNPISSHGGDTIIVPNVQFFTGFSTRRITLTSALPVGASDFKLVLSDTDGRPVNMVNSPIAWTFHIVIFKQGSIVNIGLYRFAQVDGVGTVTKL
ncbi:hypothetical protein T492DRAFT_848872 [Pavlovales sp. CCMP2436]|nr:hypothetical protein T492DRAFT_848872 [Pavlovales sp. CCMP2436]